MGTENDTCLRKLTSEEVTNSALGEWGRWQFCLLGSITIYRSILLAALSAIVFLGAPQPFSCSHPMPNSTQCGPCTSWVHNTTLFQQTVVTEWDLVCERSQLVSLVQTSFMMAAMIGSISVSVFADRYGRKVVLIIGGVVIGTAGCGAALVGSFWLFIGLRCMQGLAVGATICLTQVYCVEVLGPKGRSKFSLLVSFFAYIILIGCSGLAYLTAHWRLYQIATTIPALLSLSFYWVLPESPRWLIAVGRTEEALTILKTAAIRNKNPIPKYLPSKEEHEVNEKGETRKYGIFDLVKTPHIRKLTLVTSLNFFASGYCHYGIQQYLSHIKGNVFINATMAAVFGLGGILLALLLTNKCGRRISQCAGQLIVTTAYFIFFFLPDHEMGGLMWLKVCLAASGMIGTSACFSTAYLYSSELFPTVIRNTALGTINTCSRIGAMIAPFVVTLNSTHPQVPPVLFGCLSLIGGLAVLSLPETRGTPLPETFEDINIIKRSATVEAK